MAYTAAYNIRDTKDNDYLYLAGDVYPRDGYKPSEKRVEELLKKGAIISDGTEAEKPKKTAEKEKTAKTEKE